ncbi:MAG: hypothetical protein C4534_02380 [Gaiellales bacterium]|nr:MAG: hypothetical protein C4534_02380 [Gaiellales bacterium]
MVLLAIGIPMVLLSGDDVENPHSDEDLARLTAQMEVDYSNQKAAYNDLLAANPQDALALSGLGQIAMIEGDFPTAANYLNQSIGIDPSDPYKYELLGEAYYEMKLIDKSVAAMEQAVALAPDNQMILLNAGTVLHQAGREEEARQLWQRSYDIDPNSKFGQNAFHMLNPDIPVEDEPVSPHP